MEGELGEALAGREGLFGGGGRKGVRCRPVGRGGRGG
jgi:hypothetical protein